ncbi:MAG: hypothetical protein J1F36_02160 [Clostridiales bacterium]|nr:hypothetical protein [Clostridiales bacterium]
MTKKIGFKTFSLVFALFVAVYATGVAFAWFIQQRYKLDILGHSLGAYFAYGDGTGTKLKKSDHTPWDPDNDEWSDWDISTGPFGITNSSHMFNLAWLQTTGLFNEEDSRRNKDIIYHFELANDIDMTIGKKIVVLPPIGNAEYPFIGVFNGKGYAISNLVISTNKNVLFGNFAADKYKFSNAVGLFGNTANSKEYQKYQKESAAAQEGDEEYKKYQASISNFILVNPTVEVALKGAAGVNTEYASNDDRPEEKNKKGVGLAVGYVGEDVKVQSIGVYGGALAVRRGNYQTYNSIIGIIDPKTLENNTDIFGSGVGGENPGNYFGNTLNTSSLIARLEEIAKVKYDANGNSIPSSWMLPAVTNSNGQWSPGVGEKLAFAADGIVKFDSKPYEVVARDNTGYLLGNKTEIQNLTIKFTAPLKSVDLVYVDDATGERLDSDYFEGNRVTPNWIYTQPNDWKNSNYQSSFGFAPIDPTTFAKLPPKIRALVNYEAGQTIDNFTGVQVQTNSWNEIGASSTIPRGDIWGDPEKSEQNQWSYFGQISWNGQTYGSGLKSADGTPVDEHGHSYHTDGTLVDRYNYILNDDHIYFETNHSYYIGNVDGWSTPVYALDSSGRAINNETGPTYYYYIDGNLIDVIDGKNYLFYFVDGEKRYISALDGFREPIYGVDSEGYALKENGVDRFDVTDFYEVVNGFYRRADGTYVIGTSGWEHEPPIYFIDPNGYALTAAIDNGGMYYINPEVYQPGVYQKTGGSLLYYDINGNPMIFVGGQYISIGPNDFDDNDYAINSNGCYYTATADVYLKNINGTWYYVDADGKRIINDNGRYVTPYGFDANNHAITEEGYYYDATDNNMFYHYINGRYYKIQKSGDIWSYVINGRSMTVRKVGIINGTGYAMYNDEWYYTSDPTVYEDLKGYYLHNKDGEFDGYILYDKQDWEYKDVAFFGNDGILYANDGISGNYVKGDYYTDKNGYVITTEGAYALDGNNNITGEKIPYHIDNNGNLTYDPDGNNQYKQVTVSVTSGWIHEYTFKANNSANTDTYNQPYPKIIIEATSSIPFASPIIESNPNSIYLKQAAGSSDYSDRVQATRASSDHDYVKVKTADSTKRPMGVTYTAKDDYFGQFYRMTGGVALPNNGIWFKPSQAGVIRFVMYATEFDQAFTLFKLERPIHADGSASFDNDSIKMTAVLMQRLPAYVMFYYEWAVSQADIEAGNVEFVIFGGTNYTPYLLYLDLGASALNGDGEESGNGDAIVKFIDFIYNNTYIEQDPNSTNYGKFIYDPTRNTYIPTGVRLSFNDTDENSVHTVTSYYFRQEQLPDSSGQPDSNGYTIYAQYKSSNKDHYELVQLDPKSDNSASPEMAKITITTKDDDVSITQSGIVIPDPFVIPDFIHPLSNN